MRIVNEDMRVNEYVYWYAPAYHNLFHDYNLDGNILRLHKALGFSTKNGLISGKPMSDEFKALLQKLAGPHGHAILRTYQIKYGIEPHEEANQSREVLP